LSTRKPAKRLIIQWTTFKGFAAILLFLIVVTLIEYLIVLHATNLGVEDETLLHGSFRFPGTDWTVTVTISPLFHLVPTAVIIALVCSWTCLTRYVAIKPHERLKGKIKPAAKQEKERQFKGMNRLALRIGDIFVKAKSELSKIRSVTYLWQKIHFARASIKSALTLTIVFGGLILLVSLLTYPQLIYWTASNAYHSNPSLLSFAKSVGSFGRRIAGALAPIGWVCLVVNNALLSVAPSLRDFILSLGGFTKPLVELDDVGKYLVFQNVATWITALTALLYGGFKRKSYRYKKGRRH